MFDLVYPSEPAPIYPRPTSERPGKVPVPQGEILPLIEPNGLVYGQASRAWCHGGGGSKALHPVVHLHLIDREGRIYLQKRSRHKNRFPGFWDSAVGGHVSYGELALEALYREAIEELGLSGFNPILLGTYTYESPRDREFVFMYAAVGHPELDPDNGEVTEGKWWTFEELEAAIQSNIVAPTFEADYYRIREALKALL